LLTDITATGDKVAALKDRGLFGSSEITNKIQTQQKILDERIQAICTTQGSVTRNAGFEMS
ncbi:hypothetical protein J8803_29665, partial [Klebsiella pneumoniae]